MLACRPSSDVVVRTIELRCNDPWVLPPFAWADGIKRYGSVETLADANQPSSLGEIGEEPLRARNGKRKGNCCLLDGKRPCNAPDQRREKLSIPSRDPLGDHSRSHYGFSFYTVEDLTVSISFAQDLCQRDGIEGHRRYRLVSPFAPPRRKTLLACVRHRETPACRKSNSCADIFTLPALPAHRARPVAPLLEAGTVLRVLPVTRFGAQPKVMAVD